MKKILWCIVLVILLLSCSVVLPVAAAEGEASEPTPYTIAKNYAENYPTRDVLSGGEKSAALYLDYCLNAMHYDVKMIEDQYVYVEDNNKKTTYDYRHVIGRKDNGKGKSIVIGCYYGGYILSDNSSMGEGATNALSVGTVLYLAEKLAALSLDYDVTIAFWGGSEVSEDFDLKKSGIDLDKVALYIHLDGIAAGTSDYLYADDISREQESFFREIIAANDAEILSSPAYKKTISLVTDDSFSYIHAGLVGVNRAFMAEDIPCVNFFGGAWDYDCGMYRYDGYMKDLEGTDMDTFEEINSRNGGIEKTEKRLSDVTKVLLAGLTDKALAPALEKAASETSAKDLDSKLAYYLIVFIGSGLLIAFFVILILKQGKDRRETVWEKSFNPYEEKPADPFDEFRSEESAKEPEALPPEESPSDQDDIFKF